jgi:hypothetical protein
MLEFIVLGQVPGTHIQITFAWCVVILLFGLIWLDLKIHRDRKTTSKRAKHVDVIRPGRV